MMAASFPSASTRSRWIPWVFVGGMLTVVLVNADGLGNDFVGIALLQNVNAANISVPDNVEFS